MSKDCIPPETFEALLEAPVDDHRWQHVENCPHCRSLLAAYRSFMEEDESEETADAAAHLAAAFDERLAAAAGGPRRKLRLLRPSLIAPSLAAAALLVFVILGQRSDRDVEPSGILRSGGDRKSTVELILNPPFPAGEGDLILSWSTVPGATEYRIEVYGSDLLALANYRADSDTVYLLTRKDIVGFGAGDSSWIWRVEALRDGERLGRSPLGSLRLPTPSGDE